MKYFCFRFDVDTHKCLSKGVPNILQLGKEVDAKFTFFINMGKAVSYTDYLIKLLNKNNKLGKKIKLSNLNKLGLYDFLIAAIVNPSGTSYSGVIKLAHNLGHEIGLHGGLNHSKWQNHASSWSRKRLLKEIEFGLKELKKISIIPVGFSSPDWNGSKELYRVLQELGFQYVADFHENEKQDDLIRNESLNLVDVPTNIINEPFGVGYVEHLRARGFDKTDILKNFSEKLDKKNKLAIVYDHPCYVGTKEIEIVKEIVLIARSKGFKIVTINEVVKKLR